MSSSQFLDRLSDPVYCGRLVSMLCAISLVITFTEKLASVREYGTGGWFTWKIFRFDRSATFGFQQAPGVFAAVFGEAGMSVVLCSGLIGAVMMMPLPRPLPAIYVRCCIDRRDLPIGSCPKHIWWRRFATAESHHMRGSPIGIQSLGPSSSGGCSSRIYRRAILSGLLYIGSSENSLTTVDEWCCSGGDTLNCGFW